MKVIQCTRRDGIALVTLNHGVTNAINTQLMRELGEILRQTRGDERIHGLVLTSANAKFFSIGFDLPEVYPLSQKDFSVFFHLYNLLCLDLYTFPKPVISAITGHATAGGCIIALCSDFRLMAEGRRLLGMNESKLGLPVTYLADLLLRNLVAGHLARDIICRGDLYGPEVALQMGMVDGVLPLEEVVPAAIKKIKDIAAASPAAFAMEKAYRVREVTAQVLASMEEDEKSFISQWFSTAAHQQLGEALKQYAPRGDGNG
jgi:enoyl-CoA hydratase/carnithine racemase